MMRTSLIYWKPLVDRLKIRAVLFPTYVDIKELALICPPSGEVELLKSLLFSNLWYLQGCIQSACGVIDSLCFTFELFLYLWCFIFTSSSLYHSGTSEIILTACLLDSTKVTFSQHYEHETLSPTYLAKCIKTMTFLLGRSILQVV